jgi:plasmid stabilization system protein ParE
MLKVKWTFHAISELKSIYIYYKLSASSVVAEKIKRDVLKAAQGLSKHPLSGQLEEHLSSLRQDHRYIVVGRYKIIYLVIDKEIFVVDIFDTRQDPDKLDRSVK